LKREWALFNAGEWYIGGSSDTDMIYSIFQMPHCQRVESVHPRYETRWQKHLGRQLTLNARGDCYMGSNEHIRDVLALASRGVEKISVELFGSRLQRSLLPLPFAVDGLDNLLASTCDCPDCGKEPAAAAAGAVALKVCSRCKLTSYCSKECQRKHWKEHKTNCPPPVFG